MKLYIVSLAKNNYYKADIIDWNFIIYIYKYIVAVHKILQWNSNTWLYLLIKYK